MRMIPYQIEEEDAIRCCAWSSDWIEPQYHPSISMDEEPHGRSRLAGGARGDRGWDVKGLDGQRG
jgi:hypothetical protein